MIIFSFIKKNVKKKIICFLTHHLLLKFSLTFSLCFQGQLLYWRFFHHNGISFQVENEASEEEIESLFGEIKNEKFGSKDVDDLTGLHSIFVTVSPVLCQEVKNYYDKLKNHMKIELMKKEEGEIKKKEEIDNEEVIEDLSFESIEDQNSEREKLKIKLKKYEGNFQNI